MNLSQIRTALAHARVRPVKSLGQNFLHDQNLAAWMVRQAHISNQDFVVEIGPGLGALTTEIAGRAARVRAIEKDRRLVNFLREKFRGTDVEILHGDALDYDVRPLFAERNVKLVGNLPYYVASQLLLKFLDYPSYISLALFTLQDEMARRLSAGPRTSDFGALTLRVQLHYQVDYLRKIPSTVFFPQPEVASATVRVRPRDERHIGVVDFELFRELVRLGFSQRRKQLRNLIADRLVDWKSASAKIGARVDARAEELSREQWITLTNLVAINKPKPFAESKLEQFIVVDENDREIGCASRSKVHEDNLRHRAVHVLVFNDAGELLLQKRSPQKDRHPLRWDSSAAGHVEVNETYEVTARRELREELGIVAPLRQIGKLSASRKTDQEFISVYCGRHEGPFCYARSEIDAVKFFPAEVVDHWTEDKPEEFAPGFLECWRLFRALRSV